VTPTHLLGLDLGTSGVKALLLPIGGGEPISHTADLMLSTPRSGWSEQDPVDWWQAAVRAIRAVLEKSRINATEIAALATSGQMHGATLLDARGEVLRPCILWNDARTGEQCDWITERVGLEQLLRWVANPALAGFTAPKLLWVREHEPEVYRRIAAVLLPKDYLNFRLTGRQATEESDASGTLLFDVANRRWSTEMVEALGIDAAVLPQVIRSVDVVGRLTREAAEAIGLRAGMPVVAGGADNACAAVGMGVIGPGEVLASLGTSGTLLAPTDSPHVDPAGRLHTFCHAVPGAWYVMGVVLSAGGALRWYRDTLAIAECQIAATQGVDPYDLILDGAQEVPAGSDGLLFLPYLAGERTPHGDPDARGVFFGLSLYHTRNHMARSVIEGVTFALADSAALMRDLGTDLAVLRATGGGARSPLWRQILADTIGSTVATAQTDQGPALGAAIIAGIGAGVYSSISAATHELIAINSSTEPDPSSTDVYRRYHAVYRGLYPALRRSYRDLASLESFAGG
jgi:xylulokinase